MILLVIDDNQDITYSVKTTVEELHTNAIVHRAHSGSEGIKMAKKVQPHVIVLDIMMPDMSGWIVNKELKMMQDTKHIPVIFLTAKTDTQSRQMGARGAHAFLEKPYDPQVLSNKIQKIIKNGI